MAAKGRKLESPDGTSTPLPNVRPSSPLSPRRHSRLAEKAELQSLNDRFANYIDRVRTLETENARLTLEMQSSRDTVTREVHNIKSLYEHELSDARKLLDETAREKARLEIDTKRLWEENDELKAKLDKKIEDLAFAENSARVHESRCTELTGKYNTAYADRKKALEDVKEHERENERLRKQLEKDRKHLEDETLARVDLENTIQSLREELTFKSQVHSQELSETRTRRQLDISEIDGRLSEQYEAKLQQSLQELRDQYEGQMRSNRDEIEKLYENKIKSLQQTAQRTTNSASSANEELRMTRTKIDSLTSSMNELDSQNSALNARIRDMEKMLDAERFRHVEDVEALETELARMRDEMSQQLQEYQDLMDIKVSLDLELAAYDKMLKGEESRLNITPTISTTSQSQLGQSLRSRHTPVLRTPSRPGAGKRKRNASESEEHNLFEFSINSAASGDVEIFEADPEGKYVKLHNKGEKEVSIGGWYLVRTSGFNETTFKFNRGVKIDASGFITVWSSDAGVAHEPPTNIVMKSKAWMVSDNMKTILFNSEGDEVAGSERQKTIRDEEQQIRASVNRSGDGERQGEETCRIM